MIHFFDTRQNNLCAKNKLIYKTVRESIGIPGNLPPNQEKALKARSADIINIRNGYKNQRQIIESQKLGKKQKEKMDKILNSTKDELDKLKQELPIKVRIAHSGESLPSIAKDHGVGVRELANFNNLSPIKYSYKENNKTITQLWHPVWVGDIIYIPKTKSGQRLTISGGIISVTQGTSGPPRKTLLPSRKTKDLRKTIPLEKDSRTGDLKIVDGYSITPAFKLGGETLESTAKKRETLVKNAEKELNDIYMIFTLPNESVLNRKNQLEKIWPHLEGIDLVTTIMAQAPLSLNPQYDLEKLFDEAENEGIFFFDTILAVAKLPEPFEEVESRKEFKETIAQYAKGSKEYTLGERIASQSRLLILALGNLNYSGTPQKLPIPFQYDFETTNEAIAPDRQTYIYEKLTDPIARKEPKSKIDTFRDPKNPLATKITISSKAYKKFCDITGKKPSPYIPIRIITQLYTPYELKLHLRLDPDKKKLVLVSLPPDFTNKANNPAVKRFIETRVGNYKKTHRIKPEQLRDARIELANNKRKIAAAQLDYIFPHHIKGRIHKYGTWRKIFNKLRIISDPKIATYWEKAAGVKTEGPRYLVTPAVAHQDLHNRFFSSLEKFDEQGFINELNDYIEKGIHSFLTKHGVGKASLEGLYDYYHRHQSENFTGPEEHKIQKLKKSTKITDLSKIDDAQVALIMTGYYEKRQVLEAKQKTFLTLTESTPLQIEQFNKQIKAIATKLSKVSVTPKSEIKAKLQQVVRDNIQKIPDKLSETKHLGAAGAHLKLNEKGSLREVIIGLAKAINILKDKNGNSLNLVLGVGISSEGLYQFGLGGAYSKRWQNDIRLHVFLGGIVDTKLDTKVGGALGTEIPITKKLDFVGALGIGYEFKNKEFKIPPIILAGIKENWFGKLKEAEKDLIDDEFSAYQSFDDLFARHSFFKPAYEQLKKENEKQETDKKFSDFALKSILMRLYLEKRRELKSIAAEKTKPSPIAGGGITFPAGIWIALNIRNRIQVHYAINPEELPDAQKFAEEKILESIDPKYKNYPIEFKNIGDLKPTVRAPELFIGPRGKLTLDKITCISSSKSLDQIETLNQTFAEIGLKFERVPGQDSVRMSFPEVTGRIQFHFDKDLAEDIKAHTDGRYIYFHNISKARTLHITREDFKAQTRFDDTGNSEVVLFTFKQNPYLPRSVIRKEEREYFETFNLPDQGKYIRTEIVTKQNTQRVRWRPEVEGKSILAWTEEERTPALAKEALPGSKKREKFRTRMRNINRIGMNPTTAACLDYQNVLSINNLPVRAGLKEFASYVLKKFPDLKETITDQYPFQGFTFRTTSTEDANYKKFIEEINNLQKSYGTIGETQLNPREIKILLDHLTNATFYKQISALNKVATDQNVPSKIRKEIQRWLSQDYHRNMLCNIFYQTSEGKNADKLARAIIADIINGNCKLTEIDLYKKYYFTSCRGTQGITGVTRIFNYDRDSILKPNDKPYRFIGLKEYNLYSGSDLDRAKARAILESSSVLPKINDVDSAKNVDITRFLFSPLALKTWAVTLDALPANDTQNIIDIYEQAKQNKPLPLDQQHKASLNKFIRLVNIIRWTQLGYEVESEEFPYCVLQVTKKDKNGTPKPVACLKAIDTGPSYIVLDTPEILAGSYEECFNVSFLVRENLTVFRKGFDYNAQWENAVINEDYQITKNPEIFTLFGSFEWQKGKEGAEKEETKVDEHSEERPTTEGETTGSDTDSIDMKPPGETQAPPESTTTSIDTKAGDTPPLTTIILETVNAGEKDREEKK